MYETISSDELLYHQKVHSVVADAKAAHKIWVEHLASKYQLEDGDMITLDGRIQRKSNLISNHSTETKT